MHLVPGGGIDGHFNVLRGYVAPLALAGVKVVGDFVDNYQRGLPSEMGLLNLFDPQTGQPVAIIDAAGLTDMRTGAVTALGAKHLARKSSRVLGHIGARGTAYWNVRLLDRLFDFDEIRVHSRRPESRDAFAQRLSRDLGKPVVATDDWESCVRGADIVVEASRLSKPEPLLRTEWIKPRRLRRALRHDERGRALAHRHHGQDRRRRLGPVQGGPFGSLRAHVEAGKLSEATLHAELGEIVAGRKPGRERDDETILLWHRGLSLSDIALGAAMLDKAQAHGHRAAAALCDEGLPTAAVQPRRAREAARSTLGDADDSRQRAHVRGQCRHGARLARCCVGHRARRCRLRSRSTIRRRNRCRRCGRAPISAARSCAAIRCRRRRRAPTVLAAPMPQSAGVWRRSRSTGRTSLRAATAGAQRSTTRSAGAWRYTTPESQSGYQAPRELVRRACSRARSPLFAATVGPLVTPRARRRGRARRRRRRSARVDSYAYDLMRQHEPQWLAPLRGDRRDAADADPAAGRRARICRRRTQHASTARIAGGRRAPELAETRDALLLRGLRAAVSPPTLRESCSDAARGADALGYPRLHLTPASLQGKNRRLPLIRRSSSEIAMRAPRSAHRGRARRPACSPSRRRAAQVKVGSKNFTEQFVVAEIYAQALEAAGIKVERKINLGGTLIAHKALEEKQIDLYPEYTGTMLLAVLKAEPMTDRKAVYDKVKADYAAKGLVVLNEAPMNNTYNMVVRPETAAQYKLETLTDLAKVSKELKLGAGPEFRDRKDGLPGLKAKYGMEFKEDLQMAIGLRYQALSNKQIDVVNGYATDGMISALKLKRLKDDKNLWPPYYLAPVVRKDALDANPKIAEVLNSVSAMLDEATMAELNYKVDGEKQEPKDVARAFLKSKGVVEVRVR